MFHSRGCSLGWGCGLDANLAQHSSKIKINYSMLNNKILILFFSIFLENKELVLIKDDKSFVFG